MPTGNRLTPDAYVTGILDGNRAVLSRAITLVESTLPADRRLADQVIELCLPHSGKALRIGITGVPGVGKSTFIDAFGSYLTATGNKVAVLAVDPSSSLTRGSILGDKTRMTRLSVDRNAYIRPSPSSGTLGGVAAKTREIILLCEAAGFDHLIVETVGVGQSETLVHGMVDFFLLLMLAGAGDELQGIKRGIMELCDALVINKADGDNLLKAKQAAGEYKNALHLFPPPESGWIPRIATCSAINDEGIAQVYEIISSYQNHTVINGYFQNKRNEQLLMWMEDAIREGLQMALTSSDAFTRMHQELKVKVLQHEMTPQKAASLVLKEFYSKK